MMTSFLSRFADHTNLKIKYDILLQKVLEFISSHSRNYSASEIKNYFGGLLPRNIEGERLEVLLDYLNLSETDIINEYVFRVFSNVMNGQIKNTNNSNNSICMISGVFRNFQNRIGINKTNAKCLIEENIEHTAYYINSPFALDWLNQVSMSLRGMNILERNVISAIRNAQNEK